MDMNALYQQCKREAKQSQSYAEVVADNLDQYYNYTPVKPRLEARTRDLMEQNCGSDPCDCLSAGGSTSHRCRLPDLQSPLVDMVPSSNDNLFAQFLFLTPLTLRGHEK
jgi:hypothetical protein